MLNMIKADLFRIFKGKGIYVVILFLVFSAFMSAYSLSPLSMGLNLGDGDKYDEQSTPRGYAWKLEKALDAVSRDEFQKYHYGKKQW